MKQEEDFRRMRYQKVKTNKLQQLEVQPVQPTRSESLEGSDIADKLLKRQHLPKPLIGSKDTDDLDTGRDWNDRWEYEDMDGNRDSPDKLWSDRLMEQLEHDARAGE